MDKKNTPSIVPIKDIFIGNADGKIEATKYNFENIFYKAYNRYSQVIQTNTFIISGRKGSGKTILAYYLKHEYEKNKSNLCKICDLDDFNLQKLIDFNHEEITEKEFRLFWEWVILLELSKLLLHKHRFKSLFFFTPHFRLKNFINKIYHPSELMPYQLTKLVTNDTFNTEAYSEASTTLLNIGTKFKKNKDINRTYVKNNYYNNLKTLKTLFYSALKHSTNIKLIYDDLDNINIKFEENINYQIFIKSLICAIHKLNTDIKIKSLDYDTKIMILLRSDILTSLHKNSVNLNKITSDTNIELNWLPFEIIEEYEHPLMELILTKIRNSTPQYSLLNNAELYELLFPEKIEGKNPIDYLLDYTMGRPRDVITYLNMIISNFPNSTCFRARYFNSCKGEFSDWLYNELQNEISIYSMGNSVIEAIDLLRNMKRVAFDYKSIVTYYEKHRTSYPNIKLDAVLIKLFELGILGNSEPKQKKNSLMRSNKSIKPSDFNYTWSYRSKNSSCDFDKHFVIHYGLRKNLRI